MACGCEPKKYSVSMGCCQPVLGPIENYYTKYQIDEMLEEIESAITSGCCITPEEVDEKIDEAVSGKQDTLSAGTNIIISGNVISASGCDLTDYYTKEQVDAKIPSLSGYATEQWVLDKNYITGVDLSNYATKSEIPTVPTSNTAFTNDAGYLTEHQHLKTINNESLVGDGNITISGDCDLTNYYTTAQTVNLVESAVTVVEGEIPTVPTSNTAFTNDAGYLTEHQSLSGYATEQWVLDQNYITGVDLTYYATQDWVFNQNYITNSEVIQYITNLQNQIDSLKEQVSGCCAETGETLYRWVTMTGENDYVCSDTTKYSKEKEQSSTDGYNWVDTGNYRRGSTVLEVNSTDCTYCTRLSAYTSNGDLIIPNHKNESEGVLSSNTTKQGNMATNSTAITSVTIASCVTKIGSSNGYDVFGWNSSNNNNNNLVSITIPSGVTYLYNKCIYLCPSLTSVTCLAPTPPTMEYGVFRGTPIADGNGVIYVPAASVNAYKAASGWSDYADKIQAIP